MTEEEFGTAFVKEVRSYIGTPFQHAGRQPGLGLDCIGVLLCSAHTLNVTQFDDTRYSRYILAEQLEYQLLQFCDRAWPPYRAGTILLFNVGEAEQGVPQHTGVATGEGTFVHAWEAAGKVTETPAIPFWARRITAAFRVKEVLIRPL